MSLASRKIQIGIRILRTLGALLLIAPSSVGWGVDWACQEAPKATSSLNALYSDFSKFFSLLRCPDCSGIHLACDLSRLMPLPAVVFVGENHKNPSSLSVRYRLFRMALEKRIVLTSEVAIKGALTGWLAGSDAHNMNVPDAGTFHGMESSIPYSIVHSYFFQADQFSGLIPDAIHGQIYDILTQPLHRWAYEKLKSDLFEASKGAPFSVFFTEIDRALDSVVEAGKNPPYTSAATSAVDHIGEKAVGLSNFLNLMHRTLIKAANEKYSDRMGGVRLPVVNNQQELKEFGFQNGNINPGSMADRLFIGVRNRDFAAEISNLLCHYSGKSKKVFILLGASHVEGVENYLKVLSHDRVNVTKYLSFNVSEADVLFKLLELENP